MIPSLVDRVHCIVQRNEGRRGIPAGRPGDSRIDNFCVTQQYVDSFNCEYDHYCDSASRKLKISHRNMEEIVSVVPCCKGSDGEWCTVPDIINSTVISSLG